MVDPQRRLGVPADQIGPLEQLNLPVFEDEPEAGSVAVNDRLRGPSRRGGFGFGFQLHVPGPAVTFPPDHFDQVVSGITQRAAQLRDLSADGVVRHGRVAPDLLDDLLARQQAARVLEEEKQQLTVLVGERYLDAAAQEDAIDRVVQELSEAVCHLVWGQRTPSILFRGQDSRSRHSRGRRARPDVM